MSEFSQKRFVHMGQQIFQDLVKGYHNQVLLSAACDDDGTYGDVEDHQFTYESFAKMSFAAAEEFAKVFHHQENN